MPRDAGVSDALTLSRWDDLGAEPEDPRFLDEAGEALIGKAAGGFPGGAPPVRVSGRCMFITC